VDSTAKAKFVNSLSEKMLIYDGDVGRARVTVTRVAPFVFIVTL